MSEQQIILKKKRHRSGFTQVPNDLLCNDKISGLAKAVWCLLFSKPENWTFYWGEILSNFKEGRDSVKNAAKELEKFGYLIKNQTKKSMNGKMVFSGMEIELDDQPEVSALENKELIPITEFQSTEIPSPKYPSSEKPHTDKYIYNKNLSKKHLKEFLSLSDEEKKEKLKNLFKEKEYKSDYEKYFLFRQKQNWKGLSDLEADCAWWENGFKEKNPDKYIKKSTVKEIRTVEESPELTKIRSDIKFFVGNDAQLFDFYSLEKGSEGWKIAANKAALKYQEVLEDINVKIEVK